MTLHKVVHHFYEPAWRILIKIEVSITFGCYTGSIRTTNSPNNLWCRSSIPNLIKIRSLASEMKREKKDEHALPPPLHYTCFFLGQKIWRE